MGPTFDNSARGTGLDGNGIYFVSQLAAWDPEIHLPLLSISYSRDLDIRRDLSMVNTNTMYTTTSFGSNSPAPGRSGISWGSALANANPSISVGNDPISNPLRTVKYDMVYDYVELIQSQAMRQPIDKLKFEATIQKHQWDCDRASYLGDEFLSSTFHGLLNHTQVSQQVVAPSPTTLSTLWLNKSPQEILADINNAIAYVWKQSQLAIAPNRILLPPDQYNYINSTNLALGAAGTSDSILTYVLRNNITARNGDALQILPCKWNVGIGAGGTDRMVVYYKSPKFLRMPLVKLQRSNTIQISLNYMTTYFGAIGQIEFLYTATVGYFDGI